MQVKRKYPEKSEKWRQWCYKMGVATDALLEGTVVNSVYVSVFDQAWNMDSFHIVWSHEELKGVFG